mgnify:CR=1 FL=1
MVAEVKSAVNKELENQRNNGALGKSLEAEVTLFCSAEKLAQLKLLGDELRFVLITSKVILQLDDGALPLAEALDERQGEVRYIIDAAYGSPTGDSLTDVTVFVMDEPRDRIEAPSARLVDGEWLMAEATRPDAHRILVIANARVKPDDDLEALYQFACTKIDFLERELRRDFSHPHPKPGTKIEVTSNVPDRSPTTSRSATAEPGTQSTEQGTRCSSPAATLPRKSRSRKPRPCAAHATRSAAVASA